MREEVTKKSLFQPDDYLFVDTKGWGFYKRGKYKEVLELFERNCSLNPVCDHNIFLHLEAAKKAVTGQIAGK